MKNTTKVDTFDEDLDRAANLFEAGAELDQQIRSELNHTSWELNGRYGIAHQVRELNQISIKLVKAEAKLLHPCVGCGTPIGRLHMYCLDCAPDF